MTIEDLDRIDILGHSEHGPELTIVDPATLEIDERVKALEKKLACYRDALAHKDFQAQHPAWRNATIKVTCADPVPSAFESFSSVEFPDSHGRMVRISVKFESLRPSLGRSPDTGEQEG